jgi:tetratricopeptide (TPR) repeat protein
MRHLVCFLLLAFVSGWGQSSSTVPPNSPSTPSTGNDSTPANSTPANQPAHDAAPAVKSTPANNPQFEPPRSDRVDASALEPGESSSKDSQIDLSPPADDAKAHPNGSAELVDEGSGSADTREFHYWDPHKAAKDVEVGDFYFKRKNYKAAEDRYREALLYKANDAVATFRLAESLDKMEEPDEARAEYEAYLKILPNGPESEHAKKAIARLKALVK